MKFLLSFLLCALRIPVSVAMVWLRPRGKAKICRDLYLSLKVKLYFIPLHQRRAPLEKKKSTGFRLFPSRSGAARTWMAAWICCGCWLYYLMLSAWTAALGLVLCALSSKRCRDDADREWQTVVSISETAQLLYLPRLFLSMVSIGRIKYNGQPFKHDWFQWVYD